MEAQRGGCYIKQRVQVCVLQREGQLAELRRSVIKEVSEKLERIETKAGGLCKRVRWFQGRIPCFSPIPPKLPR